MPIFDALLKTRHLLIYKRFKTYARKEFSNHSNL
jgi:hypothetical protein